MEVREKVKLGRYMLCFTICRLDCEESMGDGSMFKHISSERDQKP